MLIDQLADVEEPPRALSSRIIEPVKRATFQIVVAPRSGDSSRRRLAEDGNHSN